MGTHIIKCPKCLVDLDITGISPGEEVQCTCGAKCVVPREPTKFPRVFNIVGPLLLAVFASLILVRASQESNYRYLARATHSPKLSLSPYDISSPSLGYGTRDELRLVDFVLGLMMFFGALLTVGRMFWLSLVLAVGSILAFGAALLLSGDILLMDIPAAFLVVGWAFHCGRCLRAAKSDVLLRDLSERELSVLPIVWLCAVILFILPAAQPLIWPRKSDSPFASFMDPNTLFLAGIVVEAVCIVGLTVYLVRCFIVRYKAQGSGQI